MMGNSVKCRKRARRCRLLAKRSSDLRASVVLEELATTWDEIAAEAEDTDAFIKAMASIQGTDVDSNDGNGSATPHAA